MFTFVGWVYTFFHGTSRVNFSEKKFFWRSNINSTYVNIQLILSREDLNHPRKSKKYFISIFCKSINLPMHSILNRDFSRRHYLIIIYIKWIDDKSYLFVNQFSIFLYQNFRHNHPNISQVNRQLNFSTLS